MYIIGIDQSITSTGICILDTKKGTHHFEIVNTTIDREDELTNYKRVNEISKKVQQIAVAHGVDMVVIEGLAMGGVPGNNARNLAALQFAIVGKFLDIGYENENLVIVAPTSLKKFAIHGGAKKEDMFGALPEMIQVALSKYPKSKGRYDLTDAYFLSKWGENLKEG